MQERQAALLEEAQRDRLANLGRTSLRLYLAHWMRSLADRLEPISVRVEIIPQHCLDCG